MITPATPDIAGGPELSEWVFDEEHLPITFAGRWVLDKRPHRLDGKTRCVLDSPEVKMFDGYDESQIQLQVTTSRVVVSAESNLDSSYPDQGLRVDDGDLIPFESALVDEKTTFTSQPVQPTMSSGNTLTVALGFWPTWPVTHTQRVSIELDGFNEAYTALQACSQQRSVRPSNE